MPYGGPADEDDERSGYDTANAMRRVEADEATSPAFSWVWSA